MRRRRELTVKMMGKMRNRHHFSQKQKLYILLESNNNIHLKFNQPLYEHHIKYGSPKMSIDIKKDLARAHELKEYGNYKESLEIYNRLYRTQPESFRFANRNDYAWLLYNMFVKSMKNEPDFFENAEFITNLVEQRDLNTYRNCPYTAAVFSVLKFLDTNDDYYSMIYWIDKINPEMLDTTPFRKYGRLNKSKKEKFYDYASRAYLKSGDYEACAEISKRAIETIDKFHDDGYSWHCYRIGKSLKNLANYDEALHYLKKSLEVKKEWYIYRDVAEIYCMKRNTLKALEYVCPAMFSNVSDHAKINVYHLIYKILVGHNPELALLHAQYFYLLKTERGYQVPEDIERLNIDESQLDRQELKSKITDLWIRYKFRGQKPCHGTVTSYRPDRNFGFIDNDVFFHKSEFRGGIPFTGQNVTFYKEESYDKVKMKKTVKAVNIRGE